MKEMIYQNERKTSLLYSGIYQGYDFYILSMGTHPCCYVRIKRSHPYFGLGYGEIAVCVHGEITYARNYLHGVLKKGWFIGWDYAHYEDQIGNTDLITAGKKWTTNELIEETKTFIDKMIKQLSEDKER